MKTEKTNIPDLFIIKPSVFKDSRGFFSRIFCQEQISPFLGNKRIMQINMSLNLKKGTVRGMHFQHAPKAEIKIVQCIDGEVFDVVVDLRKNSPTFLEWHGEILSSANNKILCIPEGCAHGFQTLNDNVRLLYFHTAKYDPEYEGGINVCDPSINIKWPLKISKISSKDKLLPFISPAFKGVSI